MKPEIERAMREVLMAWENPTSESGLDLGGAIYQLKRIYMAEVMADTKKRNVTKTRKAKTLKISQ
jgi:hypothetical protein